jgi:hypothetical protein
MLFKAENNAKAEEIRQFLPVNSSITFASLQPYIESAEVKYIKPVLGADQYGELCSYYGDPEIWPHIEKIPKTHENWLSKLLPLVQKALINLAFLDGFSILSVNIGDSGTFRQESDNQKPLFQYQEENLKNTFRSDGFNSLDGILEFLEENIEHFPIFSASDAYSVFKSRFIRSAKEYSDIYNINTSRLVFLHMQQYISQVNDFDILPVIGRAFFDELSAALLSADPMPDHLQKVVGFIKKIQVFLSAARGINSLGMNINYNGIYFHSSGTNSQNFKKKDPIKESDLHLLISNARQNGQAYLTYLKEFLHANIEDYPSYAAFNAYNEGNPAYHRDNTDKKTFWL